MKVKLLLAMVAFVAMTVSASAQQHADDLGDPDSLIIVFAHTPDVTAGDSSLDGNK